MDDRAGGVARNADAIAQVLDERPGPTRLRDDGVSNDRRTIRMLRRFARRA